MNELDKKKLDAFMDALNRINTYFQETFSDITNGGHGRLVLENRDRPFEEGLDMLLQFPSKAEFGVSSASGGEKSVATVCFLLALQNIRQLPFYIFDEIDAHLDDLNSQRLADLLKSKSKDSQFMVISLRDTTVSRANRVYGVFVQDGTSQVVSIPAMVTAK
jgi:chromosome segregation protein